tara:strand:+ start:288 stop:968 length:681 start_codon:yes stop_codon:yes gene_type:complete
MNVIISGASRGIGLEVATLLCKQGHNVLAIARSEDQLLQLQKANSAITVLGIDLMNTDLKSRLNALIGAWSQIDCIINNAGQLINKPFEETSSEDFIDQYRSNVVTSVNLIQVCLPKLVRGSHIVNITSMGGIQGSSKFTGLSAYSSSKGALSILSECLAVEFKEKGINVNALALGAVQTEMLKMAFPDFKAPLSPSEMGEYIADFALKGGRFFNGQVLNVALGNP